MKSAFLSRRHRNPQQNHEPEKEQPFFSKSNDQEKQPFFQAGAQSGNGQAIQAKLSVGQPGDKYEQEADSVANQVVSGQNQTPVLQRQEISTIQRATLATPQEDEKLSTAESRMEKDKLIQEKPELQREELPEEEKPVQKMDAPKEEEALPVQQKADPKEEDPLQKMDAPKEEKEPVQMAKEEEEPVLQQKAETGGNATASAHLSSRIQDSSGKGTQLSGNTRAEMEQAFGTDFSQVNIHTDTDAVQMNKELGAQAFTHGQDVYFNAGKYNPENSSGKRLLAHELTHVVQQGGGKSGVQKKKGDNGTTAGTTSPASEARTTDAEEESTTSGPVCPASGSCPDEFCTPFPNRTLAEAARSATRSTLLFGISQAVNTRVVPFWRQYIDGGTGIQNLDATFGTDFTNSPTTTTITGALMDAIADQLRTNPPIFPPSTNAIVLNISSLIPTAISELDTPGSAHSMDFNVIGDIPGNIAGGIGKDQLSCPAGARPSPINDFRGATGNVVVTRNVDGTLTIIPQFNFQVKDTIDLCPGNCGELQEMIATIPLSKFEASGISGDVPFEVNFPAPLLSRTITPNVTPVVENVEGITTASQLHIRASPSTAAPILGHYPRGTRVRVICSTTGTVVQGVSTWYQTDQGFISGRYVQLDNNDASLSQC